MDTVVMDGGLLDASRERVRLKDPAVMGLFELLRGEADGRSGATPPSVMDKQMTPLSGDKHDYMSVGPYWWPNPEKPDGLPWVRRDGVVNPSTQTKDFDHASNREMVTGVNRLTLAYRLTGEAKYAQTAGRWLRAWFLDDATRMNPNLNFGQAVPGINTGRGIGIIETAAFAQLLDCVVLLEGAPGWSDGDARGMREWFGAYLTWLLESPHGVQEGKETNNHGTWYDAQVVWFAMFCGREAIAAKVMKEVLASRVSHVDAQGKQPKELGRTRSMDYSAFNLEALLTLCLLGEKVGVSIKDCEAAGGGSVKKALDFLLPYLDPAEIWPFEQLDLKADRRAWLSRVVRLGHKVYGDEKYVHGLKKLPEEISGKDYSRLYLPCGE